jgi:hypothetical protein
VLGFAEENERYVEGTAAEVVDKQAAAGTVLALGTVAVSELDGRGGGLIDHSQDEETGLEGSFLGEKALVAVGVGGHANHRFQRFSRVRAEIRTLQELCAEGSHHLRQEIAHGQRLSGQLQFGVGTGGAQEALQRASGRPRVVVLDGDGIPSVETGSTLCGDDRRKPVVDLTVGRFEVHKGKIAAVDGGDDHPGSSKIDANSHILSSLP